MGIVDLNHTNFSSSTIQTTQWIQVSAPLDPIQMIQQIQTLSTSAKELTKQNEELRQHLSHENSNMPNPCQCHWNNVNNEGHSPPTSNREESSKQIEQSNSKRTKQPNHSNAELLRNMRKEMDEMKNALKGKSTKNLDGMIKRTNSPFTGEVLECPLSQKFRLPQLESYDGHADPLDYIDSFRTLLNL